MYPDPTNPFTILELQNPSNDVSELNIIRRSPDLRLSNCERVRRELNFQSRCNSLCTYRVMKIKKHRQLRHRMTLTSISVRGIKVPNYTYLLCKMKVQRAELIMDI